MKVVFSPYVQEDMMNLLDVLIDKGYLSSLPYAEDYVDSLIDYVCQNIDIYPHKPAPSAFVRYGHSLKYITYKSVHGTTWYILFETHPDCYFATYITNNQYEGHLFA